MNKDIDSEKEYSPVEISDAGWIKNTAGNPHDYDFILRLVTRGVLKGKNINPTGKMAYWRIKGQAILDYLNG